MVGALSSLTSSRRRPGPTASSRNGNVCGAGLGAAADRSLSFVLAGGLRRHDGIERAGAISKIAISTGTKLSASGAGAE